MNAWYIGAQVFFLLGSVCLAIATTICLLREMGYLK